VQEYLPQDHLARFVVEIVDSLELSSLVSAYAGSGSRPYHLRIPTHPDPRTIADFRKRFLDELAALFTQVLLIAQAMGLVKLGTVSLDATKLKAQLSKHKALSWEHANRLEAQLKGEVDPGVWTRCRSRSGPSTILSGSRRGG
jgi:transposase